MKILKIILLSCLVFIVSIGSICLNAQAAANQKYLLNVLSTPAFTTGRSF